MTAYTPGRARASLVSMDTISACATVERRICPQSMSSCHMSDEYANSPVTLRVPSGRSVDSPMPPLVFEPWVILVGVPLGVDTSDRLSLPGGREADRVHDLLVAGAAAQVARQRLADVRVARVGVALQHLVGGDQQPRRAEAALDGAGVDERLLDGGEFRALASVGVLLGVLPLRRPVPARPLLGVVREPLDGHDLAPLDLPGGDEARAHRDAVQPDRAGPALPLLAGVLRAGQPEPLAQHVQQGFALPHVVGFLRTSVDSEVDPHYAAPSVVAAVPRYDSQVQVSVRRAMMPTAWRR